MKQLFIILLIITSFTVNAQTVTMSYFGNHIEGALETSLSGSGVATAWPPWNPTFLRLFSFGYSSVQGGYKSFNWRDIEYAQNTYDWTVFDATLAKFKSKGVTDVLFVLNKVPAWAGGGAAGDQPPTNLADLTEFITSVANRAIAQGFPIRYYEVWNEPNNGTPFYSGSVNQMVAIAQTVYNAVKAVNSSYKVLSPSATGFGSGDTTRLNPATVFTSGNQSLRYANTFYAAGGGNFVDIHDYHGYMGKQSPSIERKPEAIDTLNKNYIKIYTAHGQTGKEVWNTESMDINSDTIQSKQIQFLAVTSLLDWVNGVDKHIHYGWDGADYGQQWKYYSGIDSLGIANANLINWMLGATVDNLTIVGTVYSVRITKGASVYHAVWNATGSSSYSTSHTTYSNLFGVGGTVSGSLTINQIPVLLGDPYPCQ